MGEGCPQIWVQKFRWDGETRGSRLMTAGRGGGGWWWRYRGNEGGGVFGESFLETL